MEVNNFEEKMEVARKEIFNRARKMVNIDKWEYGFYRWDVDRKQSKSEEIIMDQCLEQMCSNNLMKRQWQLLCVRTEGEHCRRTAQYVDSVEDIVGSMVKCRACGFEFIVEKNHGFYEIYFLNQDNLSKRQKAKLHSR